MSDKTGIKDQITKLTRLQEIDSEIFDLQTRKDIFPERLKEMDDSLEAKKDGMTKADEELKRLQVSKNEKETVMQSKEDQIAKHESELYQIKNNKEYTALKQEIESIRADVSLLEEDIITLFDAIEAGQAKCQEEKNIFEEEKKKVESEKEKIRAEEKELSRHLDELASKRKECVSSIDPQILQTYERILKNRGRVALARINNEFCGECNMHLRPQVLNEAKMMKDLVFCENCSRLLYVED